MSDRLTLEQAEKICRNLLDLDPPETLEKIGSVIGRVSQLLSLTPQDEEILRVRLIEVTGITQDSARILDRRRKQEPWVGDKWSKIADERKFWKRYKTYLADEKKIAPKVISRLDDLTDKILDRLADPDAHDKFDKRGLVVGNVQSGKTSNYIGLITKAADAGYKLIVVLAGIHSTLRSQTQLRIDEGFLGYDTEISRSFNQATNRIGVGRFDPNVPAHSLTSNALNGDFKKNIAETVNFSLRGSDPIIVVIKKNNSVLKNLIQWLSIKAGDDIPATPNRIIRKIPLLLIDDEADNASINISKSSVSTINGAIRALLNLFDKSAYVGYTATPYANVFIPLPDEKEEPGKGIRIVAGAKDYPVGEDLFPRDFIINIPPPSNYIGPEKFFGIISEDELYDQSPDENDYNAPKTPGLSQLYEVVNDHQPAGDISENIATEIRANNLNFIPDAHKKDDKKPAELPESLKKAIKCFILSCAARRVRAQINVHNSMLVHVTRFVDWQNHIALLVEEELLRYKNRIEFRNPTFIEQELKFLWEKDFSGKTNEIINLPGTRDPGITPVSWTDLEPELLPAVTKIRVRAVHGSKLLGGLEPENIDPLDYYENEKTGISVIAVGGNKLSRGLTLEGLTISYFLRASKMYDTLMQMGRWFGYRPGYLDLCRLFTTSDLVSHYKLVTAATVEMRAEFDRMSLNKETPDKYGLKVRADTGVLTITASNKFRYKKMMSFSYAGKLEETWQFDKNKKNALEHNHRLTDQFIRDLGKPDGPVNQSPHLRNQNYIWQGKNNFHLVIEYLREYRIWQASFITSLLADYIREQATGPGEKNLINWTIALIDNKRPEKDRNSTLGGQSVGWSYRVDAAEKGSGYYELTKSHIIGNFHEYIDLNDEQLQKAYKRTQEDKQEVGKKDTVEHPSPLRIRENRSPKNGLLLIYPLDPKPDKNKEAYSKLPIIGLAISFPEIKNDNQVVYAVNQVFMENLYDYPEELDKDDLDPDEDDQNTGGLGATSALSARIFEKLIESSYQDGLNQTDFFEGMVAEYADKEEPSEKLRSHKNLVLSLNEATGYDYLPFYSKKDIQQFYLNPVEQVVINPQEQYIAQGGCIAGLKQSKYVTFCYHDQPAVFSDSCWVIRPDPFKARYLTALFNSPMFGAWVRIKGEQRKGVYFIKTDVLYKFPLVLPEEDKLWIYDNLYELLVATAKKERPQGTANARSYYASILEGLIFCTYYSSSLQDRRDLLYKELSARIPRQLPEGNRRSVFAEELYTVLYNNDHPVRRTLYFLEDQEKVRRIRAEFTR